MRHISAIYSKYGGAMLCFQQGVAGAKYFQWFSKDLSHLFKWVSNGFPRIFQDFSRTFQWVSSGFPKSFPVFRAFAILFQGFLKDFPKFFPRVFFSNGFSNGFFQWFLQPRPSVPKTWGL